MSVGLRTQDDRRRRRLAVGAEAAPDSGEGASGGVAVLRSRQVDLPSASPWLPRQLWRRIVIAAGFWLLLTLTAGLLIRPFPPHPQLAPAINHLVDGPRPVLGVYADILLWTFAAQFCGLIGWYRSQSQLDFQGRYRLWSWPVLVFAAWGFCAGTDVHSAVGAAAGPHLRWPLWRAEQMVWLVPCMAAGLSIWWIVGRDVQRSRCNAALLRCAMMVLLITGAGQLYQPDLAGYPWFEGALLAGKYLGMGLLVTGLWLHAAFVAYVCADPPEPREPVNWRARLWSLAGWLWQGVRWFRRRARSNDEASEARSRRKKTDDAEEAPKRKRKTAAKSKRTTRARARTKVVEDSAEEMEEDAADDGSADDGAADEEWDDASGESEDEWNEDATPAPTPPPKTASAAMTATSTVSASPPPRPQIPTQKPTAPPPAAASAHRGDDDENDDDDGDGASDRQFRIDGAHGGADPFKGLSKRQRRELKRQMREQQRQQRGR